VRGLLRALARGGIVAQAGDQDSGRFRLTSSSEGSCARISVTAMPGRTALTRSSAAPMTWPARSSRRPWMTTEAVMEI